MWKAIATLGVISIVFGVVLLVWPDLGLATMTALVGAFGLVYGSLSAYAAFKLPKEAGRLRFWVAIQAILGIGTGVVVLFWPDLSATALSTQSPSGRSQGASRSSAPPSRCRSAPRSPCWSR